MLCMYISGEFGIKVMDKFPWQFVIYPLFHWIYSVPFLEYVAHQKTPSRDFLEKKPVCPFFSKRLGYGWAQGKLEGDNNLFFESDTPLRLLLDEDDERCPRSLRERWGEQWKRGFRTISVGSFEVDQG